MRANFARLLVDTGKLYPVKYNRMGEPVEQTAVDVQSRLRDIEQGQDSQTHPYIDTSSLLWLPAGTEIELDYIYEHSDGRKFRVTEITHARHGSETSERFVKCRIERFLDNG
jgi:hypothetical protein